MLPDHILTEDSNSGYQFFCKIAESRKIQCSFANGNSNLLSAVKTMENKTVLVISDGAAFGPYMEMMSDYQRQSQNRILLYVPESFEWIILSSGLIPDSEIEKILAAPYDYIDSSQFFSWENYFTALLVEKTKDSYLRYSKSVLNDAYLQEHKKLAILSVLPDVISEFFKGPGRK